MADPKITNEFLVDELKNVLKEGAVKFVNNDKKHKLVLKKLVKKGNRMSLNATTPEDYNKDALAPFVPIA